MPGVSSNKVLPGGGSQGGMMMMGHPGHVQQQHHQASAVPAGASSSVPTPAGMRADAYQRTLEYVQQCQQQLWVNKDEKGNSSSSNNNSNGEHSNPLSPDSTTDLVQQQQQHQQQQRNQMIMTKSPLKPGQNGTNSECPSQPYGNGHRGMNPHGQIMMPQH
jgi:hypothetical protein